VASRFEDLAAWQRSTELCAVVYDMTRTIADHEFKSQMRRAARAAPALIAEGFGRFSDREFVRYLRMARGELAEVQSGLRFGCEQRYFDKDLCESTSTLARRAMGTTTNLLKAMLNQLESEETSGAPRRKRHTSK
jgi:four helix bundle protein